MENQDENNRYKESPQKDRIQSRMPKKQPAQPPKKKSWKEGKFISIASAVVALVIFSLLTVYMLSESEREKDDQLFAAADEQISAVYKEMEGHLKSADSDGLLKTIDKRRLKSAQGAMNDAEGAISSTSGPKEEELNQRLIPKLKELEEYERIVPIANELQKKISEVKAIQNSDPLEESMEGKFTELKNEIAEKSKRFGHLESETLKTFFKDRYSAQITEIEEVHQQFQQLHVKIEELNTIAKEQSLNEEDFEKEVADAKKQIGDLRNSQTTKQMLVQLESAQDQFYNVKEEIRLEKIKKEEERKADEAEKAIAEQTSHDDEAYPMEFTMTDSNGFVFKLSRELKGIERYLQYDEIAKKYGGRFYYTPSSDMSYIVKDRKIIATKSLVSGASLQYKELFIDLISVGTIYSREEFADIVETVIKTGEPYKIEKGQGGVLLELDKGVLRYHSW